MFDGVLNALGFDFLKGKDKYDCTIKIDGEEIQPISARVLRTYDNPADSFSASFSWDPTDLKMSEMLRIFSFRDAKVFLGGNLVLTGYIYDIANTITIDSCKKDIAGFTKTIDFVDSSVVPPFEYKNVSLAELADSLTADYGFLVEVASNALADAMIKFKKVKSGRRKKVKKKIVIEPMQKGFEFLSDLAKQRSIIIGNDVKGDLVLSKPNTRDKPVMTLTDNMLPGYEYKIASKGRNRFRYIDCYAKTPGRKVAIKNKYKSKRIEDDTVPLHRVHSFDADSLGLTDLQKAAEFERSKIFAESFSISYPINTWYDDNGDLLEPNTLVAVESNYLEIPNGFNFFVRSVEYEFGMDGPKATLGLIIPQAFDGSSIVDPWGTSSEHTTSLQDMLGL